MLMSVVLMSVVLMSVVLMFPIVDVVVVPAKMAWKAFHNGLIWSLVCSSLYLYS